MGSVKDLQFIEKPTADKTGLGNFIFSDRYSVFDWGEMPDHIRYKGSALCIIGAYFFEKLESLGIATHFVGLVEEGKAKKLDELKNPVNVMQVKLVRVVKPDLSGGVYDYSIFQQERVNLLIPLEVIYRNTLPAGSSVFRRLKEGTLTLEEMDLKEMPQADAVLENPVLDASTKLEETDRYMNWREAQDIASLSETELGQIRNITMMINDLITQEVAKVDLTNEDGKVEYGFSPQRNLMLLDVLGTPDECRFNYQGMAVSKEVARIYYRKTDWYKEIEEAKQKDRTNWKSLVKNPPPPLPKRFLELIENAYQAFCNEVTDCEWYRGVPALKSILSEMQEWL
jgi:phosphoribosylaminoimidazole-succinocarboxamide synthase